MLFVHTVPTIPNRNKTKLQKMHTYTTAELVSRPIPTAEELQTLLSTTVLVINASTTKDKHIPTHFGQKCPATTENGDRVTFQGDLDASLVYTVALDVDLPPELEPEDPCYNPDYTPSTLLTEQGLLQQYLAEMFGYCVHHESHSRHPLFNTGRYYISSTHTFDPIKLYDFLVKKMYRDHNSPNILALSGSNRSILDKHEFLDKAVFKGASRVFSYNNPTTAITTAPIKNINKVMDSRDPIPLTTPPTVDVTTPKSYKRVAELEEKAAAAIGVDVEDYRAREQKHKNGYMAHTTLLRSNKAPYKVYRADADDIPTSCNYQEVLEDGTCVDEEGWYPFYRTIYSSWLKYLGATKVYIALEYPSTLEHHTYDLKGQYKDPTVSDTEVTFVESKTGTGKTEEHKGDDCKIFAVPSRSQAEELGAKEGWNYVPKGTPIMVKENCTMVVTFAKLASSDGCEDFHIVLDEAHRLFSTKLDIYAIKIDRLICSLLNGDFASATFVSAFTDFHRLFSIYEIPVSQSSHRYYKEEKRPIRIATKLQNLKGRVGIYTQSIAKTEQYSKFYKGLFITGESKDRPADIDLNPDKCFAFNSVMREGHSIISKIDHMVADTTSGGGLYNGADHAIQALSRARDESATLNVLHSGNSKSITVTPFTKVYQLAQSFIGSESEEQAFMQQHSINLTVLKSIKGCFVKDMPKWAIVRCIIIGDYISKKAYQESQNLKAFIARLNESGYDSIRVSGDDADFKMKRERRSPIDAKTFDEYKEAVYAMEDDSKKDRLVKQIDRLEKSENVLSTSDEVKLNIIRDPLYSIKYYGNDEMYRDMEERGILSPKPMLIKTLTKRISDLLTPATWKAAGRTKALYTHEIPPYFKANGVDWIWCTKEGRPLQREYKGKKLIGWETTDGKEHFKATTQKGKTYKYPSGGYFLVEQVLKTRDRMLDKSLIEVNKAKSLEALNSLLGDEDDS